MADSDARRYELLVEGLIGEIRKRILTLTASSLRGGPKCRVKGASGFPHQIDVAVESQNHIVLVECKHWTRKIGVQAVLVLMGRRADIEDANTPGCQVEALFATKVGATRDAKRLAKYFGLDLGVVSSESEFALRVARHVSVGVSDGVKAGDRATADIIRGGKRLS